MKHYYKYSADYLKFNEENNELEHKHKYLLKEMPKKQFAKTVVKEALITSMVCALFVFLCCLGCVEKGGNITIPLCIFGGFFFFIGGCICLGRLFDYDRYLHEYDDSKLIDKLFSEEIEELKAFSEAETLKAEQWRAQHPLEEKCRLAMTKNPNYVADLIRYVKENNNEPKSY